MSHLAAAHLQGGRENECAVVPASVVKGDEGGSGWEWPRSGQPSGCHDQILSWCQNCRVSDLELRVMMLVAVLPEQIGSLRCIWCSPPPSPSNSEPTVPSLSTCACVEYYGKALEALVKGVEVMCIHGKMKYKRGKIFMEFRRSQRWASCLRLTACFGRSRCVSSLMWAVFLAWNPLSPLPGYHTCSVWPRWALSTA